MHIEAMIAGLTQAVLANTEALIANTLATKGTTAPTSAPVSALEAPAPATPVATTQQEPPTTPAPSPTMVPKFADAGAQDAWYKEHVQKKVLKVSAEKGRDVCTAMLSKLGLASAKTATPEQWPAIIKACDEALK